MKNVLRIHSVALLAACLCVLKLKLVAGFRVSIRRPPLTRALNLVVYLFASLFQFLSILLFVFVSVFRILYSTRFACSVFATRTKWKKRCDTTSRSKGKLNIINIKVHTRNYKLPQPSGCQLLLSFKSSLMRLLPLIFTISISAKRAARQMPAFTVGPKCDTGCG